MIGAIIASLLGAGCAQLDLTPHLTRSAKAETRKDVRAFLDPLQEKTVELARASSPPPRVGEATFKGVNPTTTPVTRVRAEGQHEEQAKDVRPPQPAPALFIPGDPNAPAPRLQTFPPAQPVETIALPMPQMAIQMTPYMMRQTMPNTQPRPLPADLVPISFGPLTPVNSPDATSSQSGNRLPRITQAPAKSRPAIPTEGKQVTEIAQAIQLAQASSQASTPNAQAPFTQVAQTVPAAPPQSAPQPQAQAKSPLRQLYDNAVNQYAAVNTYMVRLRRREVVGNQARPEEVMLCKVRKQPWSIYFKWLGAEGHDREVIYVEGQHGDKIHTLTAAGDIIFVPAGRHIQIAPDSVLVKSKSRYTIKNAGIGPLIERFGKLITAVEKGDTTEGNAKFLGQVKRPEYESKVYAVLQTMPPGADPLFPRGGQRFWFFHPKLHFPVLTIAQDESGREVEYYCHDRFLINVQLSDADFDPNKLFEKQD